MERAITNPDDNFELNIQENIVKWQAVDKALAPLTEDQMVLLYQLEDSVKEEFTFYSPKLVTEKDDVIVNTLHDYVQWLVLIENEINVERFYKYSTHMNKLSRQNKNCELLFKDAENVIEALKDLQIKYQQVTTKTDSLHNLSDQLMSHQKVLKDKRDSIKERIKYFTLLHSLQDNIVTYSSNVNGADFINMLDKIDESIEYLSQNLNYKEAYNYKMKFENLLTTALGTVLKYVNHVITDATNQVMYLDNKANLLAIESSRETNINAAFSFFYGKFQNSAGKVRDILNKIEKRSPENEMYRNTLADCQRAYHAQRTPLITSAVVKALNDLRDKYKNDHSILFRSSALFVIKVCQDESTCYHFFFAQALPQLGEYLNSLCQNLYDILRPSLISINHLEVLTELCTILKEMLNEQILNNVALDQFVEIIKQLLQDVEERLVFRANIFFQHDLNAYEPSPGDLAYPEKLEQMENIAEEITDRSGSSRASVESQEVANITSYVGQFRSYTGNSPADLHGMWYPTVKRALVCLSRLYFCLEREIFQGLAQEALLICIKTIENAADKISAKKAQIHGNLFQIKHLLIIREQIAPFQVDFTIKEMSLDFSHVKSAAVSLILNRGKLFSLNSNNALLEFLLEGTPKVKEYLVDSRKEIDKQLKFSCEAFIQHATQVLVGNVNEWVQKAEHILKVANTVPLSEQEFAKPQALAAIVIASQRNIKTKIPEIQKYMKLYLANRETEFILFRPIKNNILSAFLQLEQTLTTAKYNPEDQLMIASPTPEQLNILISSVSLTAEQDVARSLSRHSSVQSNPPN